MRAMRMNVLTGALRSPVRLLSLLAMIVCISTTGGIGAPSAQAGVAVASIPCVIKQVSGSGVAVRSGPGASYASQGRRLGSGTRVQADSTNGERTWVHIVTGWQWLDTCL